MIYVVPGNNVLHFIKADWPAPDNICALTTTRRTGVSASPFAAFNLADHVGDDTALVEENRQRLERSLGLRRSIQWLDQIHGNITVVAQLLENGQLAAADAIYTSQAGIVCAVLTADCLPVLLCDRQGREVAAVHAGWRGLAGGIIESAIARFDCPRHEILAWLGPAIGPDDFEVGQDVYAQFIRSMPTQFASALQTCFVHHKTHPGKYFANLYQLARIRLNALGVQDIYGGKFCTYQDQQNFYSYRRDGQTGRMATLIYRCQDNPDPHSFD